jgi:hypothetical protein
LARRSFSGLCPPLCRPRREQSRASREAESGLYQGMGSWYASTAVDEFDRCWPAAAQPLSYDR